MSAPRPLGRLAGLAVAASLAAGGCGDDTLSDLLTFDVGVDIERQTVPGLTGGLLPSCDLEVLDQLLPGLLAPITISLRDEEELQGEGLIDEFEKVVLEDITLDIVDVPAGDSDNWDFLDSVRLFADDPTTSEPPRLVAELDPVPRGITQLVIPGTGVDVADIASADNFTVSGTVTGRVPCDPVHFTGEADFEVEVF